MNGALNKALNQIQQMQTRLIDGRRFHGWSGRARMAGGVAALAVATCLANGIVPADEWVHLGCWGALMVFAVVVSTSAMGVWFWRDPKVARDIRKLRPLLDPLAPLAVGGLLSIALIISNQWSLLVGVWALHYGLANYSLRKVLPRHIAYIAIFYLTFGALCVIVRPNFLSPWAMGTIFFIGEIAGGCVLHFNQKRDIG